LDSCVREDRFAVANFTCRFSFKSLPLSCLLLTVLCFPKRWPFPGLLLISMFVSKKEIFHEFISLDLTGAGLVGGADPAVLGLPPTGCRLPLPLPDPAAEVRYRLGPAAQTDQTPVFQAKHL
jgi:hypothetical protein